MNEFELILYISIFSYGLISFTLLLGLTLINKRNLEIKPIKVIFPICYLIILSIFSILYKLDIYGNDMMRLFLNLAGIYISYYVYINYKKFFSNKIFKYIILVLVITLITSFINLFYIYVLYLRNILILITFIMIKFIFINIIIGGGGKSLKMIREKKEKLN